MISHVHVGVADFAPAWRFYEAVMPLLGLKVRFTEPDKGWGGWQAPDHGRPLFLIGRPFDGQAADPGNGNMIALLAPDRPTVDRVFAAALAAGGASEGAPSLRPHYHPNYYGAYFRDLDGNKLCVCCHEPA
ncbi:MAG: VOC family protein [Alphaproteobacteria bacterium]|nr:VOC family protein [Alphaproteobacteria bacterium]